MSPLMLAAQIQDVHMATIILKNGASIHTKDDKGWTALHYAVFGFEEKYGNAHGQLKITSTSIEKNLFKSFLFFSFFSICW